MIKFSVIIPVYNGEETVEKLYEKIALFFEGQAMNYEVVFVYDCGKDNSWQVLKALKTKYPATITVIKLSRNFGQHNALICGFAQATGDYIITMDEDLQHDPADIRKLIAEQKQDDYDVVYGKYEERMHSGFRNLGSSILKKIIDVGIPDIHPHYSAFRLIKSDVAKATTHMQNSYTFLDGYLSWITTHCSSTLVTHNERQGGKSAYTLGRLINHTVNIFITFSNLPIRFLTSLSVFVLLVMTIYSSYIVIRKLIYNDFAMGFPTLTIMIGFGVGIIMFALGIIGEYIYRINLKTTKRPNYNIQEKL